MPTPNAATKTFEDIAVGDTAQCTVSVTAMLVDDFARLSGDYNPLHTDAAYAATTPFGRRVVHGMLVGSFFSQLVGMHLPGRAAVYLSQTLRFVRPTHLDTEVCVSGTIRDKSDATHTITLAMTAHDTSTGLLLVEGKALVRVI